MIETLQSLTATSLYLGLGFGETAAKYSASAALAPPFAAQTSVQNESYDALLSHVVLTNKLSGSAWFYY